MERRKWEDLDADCVINVFGRVGIESLLLHVPFVCKSWHKATLSPLCWETLVFPELQSEPWYIKCDSFLSRLMDLYKLDREQYFPVSTFIKYVVNRSCGRAKFIELPPYVPPFAITEDELEYIADECPELKVLLLSKELSDEAVEMLPSLVSKWKHLESFQMGHLYNWVEILNQINIHCKKITTFSMIQAYMCKDVALSIVASLPNIKYLNLSCARFERESLVIILKGCKQLVELDVSECCGFEVDDEILKLASHIDKFLYEGSIKVCIWGC